MNSVPVVVSLKQHRLQAENAWAARMETSEFMKAALLRASGELAREAAAGLPVLGGGG